MTPLLCTSIILLLSLEESQKPSSVCSLSLSLSLSLSNTHTASSLPSTRASVRAHTYTAVRSGCSAYCSGATGLTGITEEEEEEEEEEDSRHESLSWCRTSKAPYKSAGTPCPCSRSLKRLLLLDESCGALARVRERKRAQDRERGRRGGGGRVGGGSDR